MKNLLKMVLVLVTLVTMVSACEDMTIPEKKIIQDPANRVKKTPEYYENLRAYKKTEHQIAFGWFGFWNGGTTTGRGALSALPDSMDIVSIWGSPFAFTEARTKDMRYVQEVLGTRIVFNMFSHNLSNLGFGHIPNIAENIPLVAKSLADSIHKYGYDGIDFDHECSEGDLLFDKNNMTMLLREMRKHLGPTGETGKIIIVDGHLPYITKEGWSYVNYGVSQVYNTTQPSKLQGRWDGVKQYLRPQQLIVTENFEDYWETGGATYTDETGKKMRSLEGMARWQPKDANGPKGGVGAFHMEYEYVHNPDYKFMRQAIQIMNPAVKP